MLIQLKRCLLIILLCLFILLTGVSFYFYKIAVERNQKDFLDDNPDMKVSTDRTLTTEGIAWMKEADFRTLSLTSFDDLLLQGYYLPADKPTGNTAIIAHGYASKAKYMAAYAKYYHDTLGYNVLMPDARGHGASEGNYIGFGWNERKDYLRWIDYLLKLQGPNTKIVLHGVSMGGATVLMTSGEEMPDQVKAVIADCGYTSAKDMLTYQLKRMYGLPSFPIIPATSLLTKILAGYSFGEASALEQVKKTELPILFIHGEEDTFVPVRMVHELYAAAHGDKELYLVPNAEHGNAYAKDPRTYEGKVSGFLGRYIQ